MLLMRQTSLFFSENLLVVRKTVALNEDNNENRPANANADVDNYTHFADAEGKK